MSLNEARKNPEKNEKLTVYQAVEQAITTAGKIDGVTNLFVSFTTENKLGINPNSFVRDTPIGIYAYPAEYVLKMMDGSSMVGTLPYVGRAPKWANIFSVKGNIYNIQTMSDERVLGYVEQLYAIGERRGVSREVIEKIVDDSYSEGSNPDKPGGRLWYITWTLASTITSVGGNKGLFYVMWNRLFRDIGIDGLIDADESGTVGQEIIHYNEPCQAMFLSTDTIEHNTRIPIVQGTKERGTDQKAASIESSANIKQTIDKIGEESATNQIISGQLDSRHIKGLSAKNRERVLTRLPDVVGYLRQPSAQEQALAVVGNPNHMISYLVNTNKLTDQGLKQAYALIRSDIKKHSIKLGSVAKAIGTTPLAKLSTRTIAVQVTPYFVYEIGTPATIDHLVQVARKIFANAPDEQAIIRAVLPRTPRAIRLVSDKNLEFALNLVPSSQSFLDDKNA